MSLTCKTCAYYKFAPIFDLYDKYWTCNHKVVGKFVSCPPATFGCIEHKEIEKGTIDVFNKRRTD